MRWGPPGTVTVRCRLDHHAGVRRRRVTMSQVQVQPGRCLSPAGTVTVTPSDSAGVSREHWHWPGRGPGTEKAEPEPEPDRQCHCVFSEPSNGRSRKGRLD